MSADKMTRLEKIALTSAVSGAVFNVFLYGIGATLADAHEGGLYLVRGGAAVIQAAAFDLVAIATVMGMRHGRRSGWSLLTAIAAALVSALIALDVAGVWAQPWLHAANALIVLAFTLHLLTPPKLDADERQKLTRLVAELAEARQDVAERDNALASRADEVADIRRQAAELRRQLASIPTTEVVYVAKGRLTWAAIEQLIVEFRQQDNVSLTTIRRRVAALAAPALEETT
jgi:hypothetical protein